jgi:hypothetical protein
MGEERRIWKGWLCGRVEARALIFHFRVVIFGEHTHRHTHTHTHTHTHAHSCFPYGHLAQLEFFAHLFYWLPPDENRSDCYSWPAVQVCAQANASFDEPITTGAMLSLFQCDGYAFGPCSENPGCYGGTTRLMRPGALLAVPPVDAPALNATLATEPARRILAALSTYGAYVVDDTYW